MFPSQPEFLKHILDECSYILKVTAGKTSKETFADETLSRAIVRSLEIMGEEILPLKNPRPILY